MAEGVALHLAHMNVDFWTNGHFYTVWLDFVQILSLKYIVSWVLKYACEQHGTGSVGHTVKGELDVVSGLC